MKRVLNVGQCSFDHGAISRLIEARFAAEVVAADDWDEAQAELRRGDVALVLVNRKLDVDGSDGLEIVRAVKADSQWSGLPLMMVTNYPEHQQAAVTAGAEPGFGKSELLLPATIEKLARHLDRR
jgi:CheY-like chemotaxis protein